MNQVIHKYRLPFYSDSTDTVAVSVRVGELMHLAMQDGDVHVWAAVDPAAPKVPAQFRLVATGSTVDPSWCHLGTVLDRGYVWHVFAESDALGLSITPKEQS